MPSGDFRDLGRDAQEALRSRAIHLVRELGYSQTAAARAIGASRQIVNQWVRRHVGAGHDGPLDRRRNSPPKGKSLLAAREAARMQGCIRDKCPDQLKLPYMLWTAPVVRELIRRRQGKERGGSTVRLYLERQGFTPQKPMARISQRSDAAITRWLHQEYPLIARRAKREKRADLLRR